MMPPLPELYSPKHDLAALLELLEHLGSAIGERAGKTGIVRLNIERFDDAINDERGVALGAHGSERRRQIEVESERFCEGRAGISKHADLAISAMRLTPRTHNERVVDRHADDLCRPRGFQLRGHLHVSRQVSCRAAWSERSRDAEKDDLPFEKVRALHFAAWSALKKSYVRNWEERDAWRVGIRAVGVGGAP